MNELTSLNFLPTQLPTTNVAGINITTASRQELADAMVADCLNSKRSGHQFGPRLVFDANGHAVSLRERDKSYRQAFDAADLVHADGGFLVTISRYLSPSPIKQRSATTDLFDDFAARATKAGLSIYLLGGTEQVNQHCADLLPAKFPGLNIAGRHHGYFKDGETDQIIADINAARPDILWVGMGKPKEQAFGAAHKHEIKAGWLITCGGSFSFFTGAYKRAPVWMQNFNLEWLHRLLTRPRQLFWRYLTTSPHALWLALTKTKRRPLK